MLSQRTVAGDQAESIIPRQLFDVPIQASLRRIISRATIKALRKMFWPSATAVILPARRSCWKSRKKETAHENGGMVEIPRRHSCRLRLEDE
jgi:translation elongation factor EF-4